MDPAYIALIGTVCGGVGLKIAEHYLGKGSRTSADAARIRDELRLEITNLREDVKDLEDERDKYRSDYYALYEKFIAQQTELTLALAKIKQEAEDAARIAEKVSEAPPPTPPPTQI